MLDLTVRVFFIRRRIWIAEWDYCIMQLTLLACGLHIHLVDIKCVLHKALVCRGPIKCEDCSAIWVGEFKDLDRDFELLNQLREIPPSIKSLSGIDNLLSLEGQKAFPCQLIQLISNLILGEFNLANCFRNEIGDMDRSSIPLLPYGLLITCEPHIVLSRLGLARFGSAQQRFDQIGQAKPNQTVACGLSHGSLAFLDVDISLFWMAEQPELNQGV
jgi:hypothetical protein